MGQPYSCRKRGERIKREILFIVITITFSILPFLNAGGDAAVHSGCLNCHQYPGMAVSTKEGEFKGIHIDAERYFSSPHGEFDCRDCHTGVSEMPPRKKPAIDCRSRCHKGEKERALVESYPLEKLHEGERSMITSLKDGSPCRICHELYPHSKNRFIRAILNRHAALIVCEVCHLDRKGLKNVAYDWIAVEEVKFMGKPFGSFYDKENKELREAGPSISRLGILSNGWFTKKPLMKSWSKEKAAELGIAEKDWNTEESILAMNYFHEGTTKMVPATACQECHSLEGMIDFKDLGFSKKRIDELVNMDLKRTITNYDEFHMPNLFGR